MKIKNMIVLVAVMTLAACAAERPLPQRAIVTPSLVSKAIEIEQTLDAREGVAVAPDADWFKVVPGRIPVILTAPHATRPLREGNRRFSDGGGTAALALSVAELTGAYVIYTTHEGPSDPNYYDDNAFKRQLGRLIAEVRPRYVLDIHGSHPFRPYDIDLGTMGGRSLLGQQALLRDLIASLEREGLQNISYNYFGAAKNRTITKFAAGLGVPAIQVEVNTNYLSPSEGNIQAQHFSQLAQALVRYVQGG
ncbi:hypothetical protein [Microbulbifer sp. SAOS-129_SWC]|uniref:hypothetical protein n=1 Tax=Microbulbifer sp. SAOS-129_SWC TaxID=3145235 RepID=UPI003216E065